MLIHLLTCLALTAVTLSVFVRLVLGTAETSGQPDQTHVMQVASDPH